MTKIDTNHMMVLMAKKDPKAFVTNETLDDAVNSILSGLDNLLEEQKKTFATKDDLKQFATKEDLHKEVSWLRGDIRDLKADLSDTPSRKEFNQLKTKVDKYLPT